MTLFPTPTCFVPITCAAVTYDKEINSSTEGREGEGRAYGLLSMCFFLRGKYNNSTMGLHTGYASLTSVQLLQPIIEGYLL